MGVVHTVSIRMPDGVESALAASFDLGLLRMLGIRPLVGYWPGEDEMRGATLSAPRHVLVSERFWSRRMGRTPNVVGTVLRVPQPVTVTGVLPDAPIFPLAFQGQPEMVFPVSGEWSAYGRVARSFGALVRLEPDVPLSRVRAEVERRAAAIRAAYPRTMYLNPRLAPLSSEIAGKTERLLWLLFAATGAIWLLATANFAALVAVRFEERRAELAVRAALGARLSHLVFSAGKEVLATAALGSAAGGVAAWAVLAGLRMRSVWFHVPRLADAGLDGVSLAFGVSTALAAGILAVALNARRLVPASIAVTLQGSRGSARGPTNWSRASIAAQFCLALMIANLAAVTARSLLGFESRALGYDPSNLLAMRITLPRLTAFVDRAGRSRDMRDYQAIIDFAASLPGGEAATGVQQRPGKRPGEFEFALAGGDAAHPRRATPAALRGVAPNYLAAMRLPLLRGRWLLPGEDYAAGAAVVNHAFVAAYLGNAEPIGSVLEWNVLGPEMPFRIVGVAGDSLDTLLDGVKPAVYLPGFFNSMDLMIRAVHPQYSAGQVERYAHKLDPAIIVDEVQTIDDTIQAPLGQAKTQVALSLAFAVVAIVVAAAGLCGSLRYAGRVRRREYAIRIALGAAPAVVVRMRVGQTLRAVLCGLGLGALACRVTGRLAASLLFGIPAADPAMLASAAAVLLTVALVSAYVSASEAENLDANELLRSF
jgi:putative ABC transport system permease protein